MLASPAPPTGIAIGIAVAGRVDRPHAITLRFQLDPPDDPPSSPAPPLPLRETAEHTAHLAYMLVSQ